MSARRLAVRIAAWTLAAATAYTAAMTLMWALHMGDLRSTAERLEQERADAVASADADLETVIALSDTLEMTQLDLVVSANRIAKSSDYQVTYGYLGEAMVECVDAREETVGYVKDRHKYVTSSLRAFEREVDRYCGQVRKALNTQLKEEEADFAESGPDDGEEAA